MVNRFKKFSLNFSILLFVIHVDLLHPCSFMVYYYLFRVFLSFSIFVLFSGFLEFRGNFVDSRNN